MIVRAGDTMERLARRYRLSVGSLARINRRSRQSELMPGETIVVYAPVVATERERDEDTDEDTGDASVTSEPTAVNSMTIVTPPAEPHSDAPSGAIISTIVNAWPAVNPASIATTAATAPSNSPRTSVPARSSISIPTSIPTSTTVPSLSGVPSTASAVSSVH